MKTHSPTNWPLRIAAGVAVVFGLLTIVSGGGALFGGPSAQAAVGDAVPFVLWFNFVSGFAYVFAGVGIAMERHWAAKLATGLAILIAVVFALFGLHIYWGGAFEMRTVGAKSIRLAIWAAIAAVVRRYMVSRIV